jgi:hypothetical protein
MPRAEPLFFSDYPLSVIRYPLLSCYHRPPPHPTLAMEINQIRRSLEDLTERNEALRRFL